MKKLALMVFLPVVLFALERVNLIKDAGFEKDSELWLERSGGMPSDTAIANRHDPERAFKGSYSGSCDTRNKGEIVLHTDSAYIIQPFNTPKKPSDFDSLLLSFSITPMEDDPYYNRTMISYAAFYIDGGKPSLRIGTYCLYPPPVEPIEFEPMLILGTLPYSFDTTWQILKEDPRADLERRGFDNSNNIDSFLVLGWGGSSGGPWAGQKIYWDDIRLTGYADYDVGIKGILSGDSVWKSTAYTPTARIKNFGRKPADTFLVIAEIKNGVSVVYSDTMPYSLPADTEDTVSFKEFTPPDASNYTLTVRTEMTPDESDEDDEMSKTLYGSGIEEIPSTSLIMLEVARNTRPSLLVSYSIPNSEQGTLTLYDPSGRRVESLRVQGEGQAAIKAGLSSGVYFIRLETEKMSVTKKTLLLR